MWRSLANPIDPGDPEKERLYGEMDGDDELFISADHRRPHYLAQDAFLKNLKPHEMEALQKARESYMTPMERRWERGKETMQNYWEVDTKILETLTGSHREAWGQWLIASDKKRLVLKEDYYTEIKEVLSDVRSHREGLLYGNKELQKELTFWGYINDWQYISEEEQRRRRSVVSPFAPTGPGTTATPVSGLVPPAAEQYAPEETEPPGTVRQQQQPVLAP
jgi:hypothetical protein